MLVICGMILEGALILVLNMCTNLLHVFIIESYNEQWHLVVRTCKIDCLKQHLSDTRQLEVHKIRVRILQILTQRTHINRGCVLIFTSNGEIDYCQ